MANNDRDMRAAYLRQAYGIPGNGYGVADSVTPQPYDGKLPVAPMPGSGRYEGAVTGNPGGGGFNRYAVGKKPTTGVSPNVGPMADKTPFQERDRSALTQRNAMLRRLKARQKNNYFSSDNLGYQPM